MDHLQDVNGVEGETTSSTGTISTPDQGRSSSLLDGHVAQLQAHNDSFVAIVRQTIEHAEAMVREARAQTEVAQAEAVAARREVETLRGELHTEVTAAREALHADSVASRARIAAANAELDTRRASFAEDAQRDADKIIAEAKTVAQELLMVARADAREAVKEERDRARAEYNALIATREEISAERQSLTQFHTELSGRLRQLVHAMADFAIEPQTHAVRAGATEPVETIDSAATPVDAEIENEANDSGRVPPSSPPVANRVGLLGDDDHLDRAFEEFFSSEVDHEPSRRWILED